ncbi:hypothetical protein GGH19_004875 [Coemansia sp. RSA 1807]|nr:hypothetical protein GGH19_004875 [Coemansia sp. RSA 1807]
MQFAKLPDSVVYLIIRYSLSLNTRTPVRFKENVGLLAVCHKLRILGLPLVYDAVFIYPTMFGAYTSYADQIKNAQSLMGPGIDTNLDLIHEGGLSSVVNTFMVELHFDTQPFSNLRHILGTLSRVNNRWSSVEKLHFVFRPDLFAMDGQNLGIQSLKLGDFNHDPIPEPNSHTRVTPFNTRLKSLDLHFNEHEFSAYAVVQVVKMLLLKMPTLERVVSPKVPKKSVLEFIGEYKEEYPHLKYLDFMWHTLPEIEGY